PRGYWLKTLTRKHQTAIKRLQPCKGCKWIKTLSGLSNPDKHRRLTFVRPVIIQARDGAQAAHLSMPMQMTLRFTGKITLHDGSGVIETLKLLKQEVSDAIEAFSPDFQ